MRKIFMVTVVVFLALLLAACHGPMGHKTQQMNCGSCDKMASGHQKPMAQPGSCCKVTQGGQGQVEQETRADVLYACDCGNGCDCNTLSKTPGACACGKDLRWHHVVKVEQNEALLCGCEEGCACKLDPNDATRCACGKPVKRVDLKGSGLFFCNCGGSCFCNTVKNTGGECRCGMPLKQAE